MNSPAWRPAYLAPPGYPPAQPGLPAPPQALPSGHPGTGRRRAGLVATVIVSILGAGLAGVLVGTQTGSTSTPTPAAAPDPAPPSPTTDQIRAQTIDLCTRFAAGYAMLPSPPRTAADIGPAANYIADALRDNASADPTIRTAIAESLRLYRDRAAMVSREPARGAVQPPTNWNADTANAADNRVWSACDSYQG